MAVSLFNLKYSAVIVMVAALLAGLAFALAHDAFYQSLNGKPILKAQPLAGLSSSFNISDQQVYLSLGTLFAFLVKSFLGAPQKWLYSSQSSVMEAFPDQYDACSDLLASSYDVYYLARHVKRTFNFL
ncbi:hypothetical protein PENSOL_c019G01801 [Penicillium solitum]|uniref:Uncharacterized protein n=1 Tax=Penicillium solitum TaxID=60172 RepID=A0A1V6R278_9EURO|nr:uncharacterized protein PENSOL_c019G01801 [Penicillium solitum]OQD95584.1 hypothetical protein PENSOL_c019G01801 [Penicillium solitum]